MNWNMLNRVVLKIGVVLIICYLPFIGCNQTSVNLPISSNGIDSGEWRIYQLGNFHSPMRCNGCPWVSFYSSGKGVVRIAPDNEEIFTWESETGDSILYVDNSIEGNQYLGGTYKFTLRSMKKFDELLLLKELSNDSELLEHVLLRRSKL